MKRTLTGFFILLSAYCYAQTDTTKEIIFDRIFGLQKTYSLDSIKQRINVKNNIYGMWEFTTCKTTMSKENHASKNKVKIPENFSYKFNVDRSAIIIDGLNTHKMYWSFDNDTIKLFFHYNSKDVTLVKMLPVCKISRNKLIYKQELLQKADDDNSYFETVFLTFKKKKHCLYSY